MYLIPRNISNRFEFFPGWGWRELIITAISVGIGLIFSFLIGLATLSPVKYLPVIIFAAIGYTASRPVMADGSTAIQIVKYIQRFKYSQKRYLYQKGGF